MTVDDRVVIDLTDVLAIRRYSPGVCVGADKTWIMGNPTWITSRPPTSSART
jgi:hypothetical protein